MNEKYSGKATLTLDGPYGSFSLELDEYEIDKSYDATIVHATTKKDMQYTSNSTHPHSSSAAHVNCKCSSAPITYNNDCAICKRNDNLGKQPVERHPARLFQGNICLQHYAEYAAYLKSKELICNSSDEDDDD